MANPSPDKGNADAEEYLRNKYGAYRGHPEWRALEAAFNAGRAIPPSPSTAPEVPPFPESFGLADVPHAMNTPDDWDADYRATWQKLQVAEINLSQMRAYARKLRASLASRPAEVDDEGLPGLPQHFGRFNIDGLDGHRIKGYTAEQYRQGQRDAVAAYKKKQASLQELADQAQENDMGYGDAVAADRARSEKGGA